MKRTAKSKRNSGSFRLSQRKLVGRSRAPRCSRPRFEQLESRRLLAGDMTNPDNPLDVNNDQKVSASDALAIINYLGQNNAAGEGEQLGATNSSGNVIYPDTSGNGSVAASDALRVINALAEGEVVDPPAPDLSVTSVSVDEDENEGTAVLANTGDTSAAVNAQVRVEVEIDGQFQSLGDFAASFAQGASTTSVTVPFDALETMNIPSGTYDVLVTVDPPDLDNVDETNESNNDLETSLTLRGVENTAGDPMSAAFRTGNSPKVTLSGNDQTVTVTSPQAGQLRFQGMDLDRTIGIRHDLKIKVHGSGNQIIFDNARIPDDMFVYFHGPGNAIRLTNTSVGDDFIFHGSNGADVVAMDGGSSIRETVVLKGKHGNDSFLVQGATVGRDMIVYAGDGNDTLAANNLTIRDDAIVRMGDDNDLVSMQNAAIRDVANIKGGRNQDTLSVDSDTTSARRFRQDDFESQGAPVNVQALIDQVFGNIGQTT